MEEKSDLFDKSASKFPAKIAAQGDEMRKFGVTVVRTPVNPKIRSKEKPPHILYMQVAPNGCLSSRS